MEDNWNPEDWQGRSKRKVEDNYKTLDLTFKIIGILGFCVTATNKGTALAYPPVPITNRGLKSL